MDEQLLKHTAINSVALMLMVIVISIIISQYNQPIIYANGAVKQEEMVDNQNLEGDIKNISTLPTLESDVTKETDKLQYIDNSIRQQLGDRYLIIKKSDNSFEDINIEDLYMERSISVTIKGLQGEVYDKNSILRVNQGVKFSEMPILEPEDTQETLAISNEAPIMQEITPKSIDMEITPALNVISDPMKGLTIQYSKEENTNLYTATIKISLDNIYAPILYQDEENIYIALKRPKDVYDKIIVVDAGHGGKDSGTYSKGEQYYEKDINLSILLYLKELLDQEDIKVYYTRTTDQTVFLNPRVKLANDVEADFFLSIHCNANESSVPSGTEILYNQLDQTKGFQSKQLAQLCLEEITNITHNGNRGLAGGSEMVIIKKANMPVALSEVAFMSNQEDLEFLLKEENKKNIAGALSKVIIRAYDEINGVDTLQP